MEKPKNVIVPAVGALALGLWAGLSACTQQPGNQTQQSMQQSQSGDQQPQSREQQNVRQSQSGQEAQAQQPQSGEQQQAEQQPAQSGQQSQQPQGADQQQRAQQPQSGQQQAEQQPPQSGEQRAGQPQTGEQHAQQPQNQNNNPPIASNGQNETATLNLNRDQIEQVQRALNQKGFKAGRADGKMGPQTESAVRSFQQQQKLEASGQINQQTLVALGLNNLTQSTAGQGGGRQQPAARQQ